MGIPTLRHAARARTHGWGVVGSAHVVASLFEPRSSRRPRSASKRYFASVDLDEDGVVYMTFADFTRSLVPFIDDVRRTHAAHARGVHALWWYGSTALLSCMLSRAGLPHKLRGGL